MSPVRALSPELQEKACKELNEVPARREQDLAHIKEWLKKQPHIKARTDDQWLLTFLRGCKFSLERTKEKLDTYYTCRTLLPEFFNNRDPMLPEIQEVLAKGTHLPFKTTDDKGRRIILLRIGQTDPKDDDLIVSGDNNMMDFAGMGVGHMVQMTPAVAKKMTMCFQEAYPFRPKSMNYINFPTAFMTVFNMVQSFLKDKLKKRVHVHATLEDLYKEIPKHVLPKDYGGEGESLEELGIYWKKKVESYRDWFLEDEKNKTDEKKRVGKPKTQESLFGLEGSFRQLNVD